MKTITVTQGYHRVSYTFIDGAKADAAYAAIAKAMAEHKEFGNSDAQTVTVSGDHGESTFRVSQLVSVFIEDTDAAQADLDAVYRYRATQDRRRQDIDAELGLTPRAA